MSRILAAPDFRAAFDDQAVGFDRRAGLPATAVQAITDALAELGGDDGRLLDLGAGTGNIGRVLAGRTGSYLGLDRSLSMLTVFANQAIIDESPPQLVCGDADAHWPLADRSIRLVFSARAVHRLDAQHLMKEILRVTRPGALVVLGRVERTRDSVRRAMRSALRRLLAEHGVAGRRGERRQRDLLGALETHGATRLAPRIVARWQVDEQPAASLASWHGKQGLAGRRLDQATKDTVLRHLEAWARRRFGDLDRSSTAEEQFTLTATRLPEAA